MTISAEAYFAQWKSDRKKEPRYLAVIDKDSCTSCNACATVCPVDCIYEVVGQRPTQSYHVIDSRRCIGCQLCYRIPSESTQRYTLEVCPWNAIDMLHNPNVARDEQGVLQPYYLGQQRELPWGKLEEYGYQLALNGQVRVAAAAEEVLAALKSFEEPDWGVQEDRRKIVERPVPQGDTVLIAATAEGGELLRFLFRDYSRIFLD